VAVGSTCVGEPAGSGPLEGVLECSGPVERTVDQTGEPDHHPVPSEWDQVHRCRRPRVEAHDSAGRDVEPPAVGGAPVEPQAGIALEEVEMRGDRDRHGRLVGDLDPHGLGPGPPSGRSARVGTCCGHDRTGRVAPEVSAADRVGDGDQPRPVAEYGLHLDLGHDVRHTGQDVIGTDHGSAHVEGGDHGEPVPGRFGHRVGHQGHGLGHVQPEPPCTAGPGQRRSQEQ
jgi:hypothetical protein